jgi:hypothetical protein
MPTLRLVYLTDQQYAGMTDHPHGAANNTTAEIPSINQEQTRLPIADATRKGTKRKRRAPVKSFDDRLNDLMAFKAKYGHCDVSRRGEDPSLGKWCSELRGSYKKVQNNQKPRIKLSDEQIRRLNDAGFKWSLQGKFEEHFKDLMAFKAKHGHCDVAQNGEDVSLGRWCCEMRVTYKKMKNNQKTNTKLADEQIQRLNDAGFKWSLRKIQIFDVRFNDLMAFKAN